jgi:hypothetical protein
VSVGRSARALLLVTLALSLVVEAAAQPTPSAGASATYRWTSTMTDVVPVLVLERDASGGVKWSVTRETAAPTPLFVAYAIVKASPKTYALQITTALESSGTPLSVTQVTVDRASGKAVRSVIQRPKGVIETPESGLRPMREVGVPQGTREDVTVPAGRFSAVRGTVQGAQVWVSDQVPAMGLVKAVWPSGTLELVSSAPSGAKDLLARGR